MAGNLFLSIGIPIYYRPTPLGRLLRTVESIHHELFEIFITDSSESDESKNIASQILTSKKFSWTYHKNVPSVNATENINNCIHHSKGRFVYIIHDDDFLVKGGLITIIKCLQKFQEYKTFMFGVSLVYITGNVSKKQLYSHMAYLNPEQGYLHLLNNSSFIRFPSMVVAKEAYDKAGFFDANYHGTDDTDMWIRLLGLHGLYCIPEITSYYSIHEQAETARMFTKEIIYVLLKLFDKAEKKNILPKKKFDRSKTNFFLQFILAGTYRALKIRNFTKGREIIDLFKIPEIRRIAFSYKWYPVKIFFSILIKLNAKISSNGIN